MIAPFGDHNAAGLFRRELRGEVNMLRNSGRFEAAEVILVHPAEKILEDVGRDILAEGRDGLLNLFAIWGESEHGQQYNPMGFIV